LAIRRLILALALLALALPAWAGADPLIPARCVEAVDGDSLRVDVGGILVEVRLLEVDAPEHDQEWGREAADFTRAARAGFWGQGGLKMSQAEWRKLRRD
jgi:endonuclease YncB( thermonuclease family)